VSGIIKKMLAWCWNWICSNGNASAKVYTSPTPAGRRLGGHDDPLLRDFYVILDVRAAGKILLFGYFQAT
jgi:hypothetical protein